MQTALPLGSKTEQSCYRRRDDGRYRVVNVSGGRSSGYMLARILHAHGGELPRNTVACFANTGKEREETLEFVDRMSRAWNVPITWLEYRYRSEAQGGAKDPKHAHAVVNFESASRNGEPFQQMNGVRKMLPTAKVRACTAQLKVETIERYCIRDRGWPNRRALCHVIGIRADEPHRIRKALYEECRMEYPMVDARVTKQDVRRFWEEQPFDLMIDSWKGNCDLCPLKRKGTLLQTMREEPWRAQWWIEEELKIRTLHGSNSHEDSTARFRTNETYEELANEASQTPTLPMFEDDLELPDCFCGS